MKNQFTIPSGKKPKIRSTSRIYGTLLAAFITTASFGQVGINTTTPDPSAALDIQSSDKGILIPKVSLQSSVDKITIPNPANGLLVFNTNADVMDGAGFYYNLGTPAVANWVSLADFKLPVNKSVSTNNAPSFRINNFSQTSSSSAIHAYSQGGYALIAEGNIKIIGNSQSPGTGKVLTADNNGNATWEGGIAFRASGVVDNGAHILAPNTDYKIPFKTIEYDRANNYSNHFQTNADTFIASLAGIYHFDCEVSWSSSIAFAGLFVTSGGTSKLLCGSNTEVSEFGCSTDVKLQVGDQVFVSFRHNNEQNLILVEPSHFSGHFVQSIK